LGGSGAARHGVTRLGLAASDGKYE
jgi:hypothetical protein